MCGPVEREFKGEAAPKIYKEFPQIINKKKQPNSQLGKRIHRKGNTNGPYMCEKMFLFIGNQGHEKLPTNWQKFISLTISSVGKDTEQLELLSIYDRCKIGATTPIIILFRKTLAHVYQGMCTRKFTFLFVTAKNWK